MRYTLTGDVVTAELKHNVYNWCAVVCATYSNENHLGGFCKVFNLFCLFARVLLVISLTSLDAVFFFNLNFEIRLFIE